jgi:hypothetical protein
MIMNMHVSIIFLIFTKILRSPCPPPLDIRLKLQGKACGACLPQANRRTAQIGAFRQKARNNTNQNLAWECEFAIHQKKHLFLQQSLQSLCLITISNTAASKSITTYIQ